MIDETARQLYRQRIEQLRAELEHADRIGDADRSARTDHELQSLIGELRSGTGLNGRSRSFVTSEENARVAVQKAIRRNIERITKQAPRLGSALTASIQTGTYCRYVADPLNPVTWSL